MRLIRTPPPRRGRAALAALASLTVLIGPALMPAAAQAGIAAVSKASVWATVSADGSLTVTESRVFRLSTLSTGEQVVWELEGPASAALDVVSVLAPTGRLAPINEEPRAGEYMVVERGEAVRVYTVVHEQPSWEAPDALRYVVRGAVVCSTPEIARAANVTLGVPLEPETRDVVVWLLGLGAPSIGVAFYLSLFFTLGRGYRIDVRRRSSMDVPADLPPAVVAVLWNERAVTTRGLAATVLDLVRRDVLAVAVTKGANALGTAATDLRSGSKPEPAAGTHERIAYDLLVEAAGGEGFAGGAQLRRYLRRHPHVAHERMIQFYSAVMTDGGRELRERLSPRASFAVRVVGALVCLAGTVATARSSWPPCVLGAAAGAAMIVFARSATLRPSPKAVELYRRCRALRRYLVDVGRMGDKQSSPVVLWERYLVLAVVFGVADRVQRVLQAGFPAPDFASAAPTLNWFGSAGQAYGLALDGFDPAWRG